MRNWILIVPTSNCSSHEAATIAMQAEFSGLYSREKYPNVDGVTAIPHTRGCGCPDMIPAGTPGHRFTSMVEATMRLLANHIRHPNVGAALVIELGCEKTNLSAFNRFIAGDLHLTSRAPGSGPRGAHGPPGGPERCLRQARLQPEHPGLRRDARHHPARAGAGRRNCWKRPTRPRATPIPASELALGLECGGSDAFSGLSANPALGYASDLLIRAGGTSIISETPEFFGAEHLFAQRAVSREVARGIFDQIQRYRNTPRATAPACPRTPARATKRAGCSTSPSNRWARWPRPGTAPVQGVIDYGEPYWQTRAPNGLYLMYGPGYDPESVPAMVASGCQMVCFTTGRGSVLGNAIAPVIKIATNSPMYQRMSGIWTSTPGVVLDGAASRPRGWAANLRPKSWQSPPASGQKPKKTATASLPSGRRRHFVMTLRLPTNNQPTTTHAFLSAAAQHITIHLE